MEKNITTNTYTPRTKHSATYYFNTIMALVDGLRLGMTDKELSLFLTGKGLQSPIGNDWTPAAITKALWKLRQHKSIGSTLHQQLLQLLFDGLLKPADVLPLYQARNSPRMTM